MPLGTNAAGLLVWPVIGHAAKEQARCHRSARRRFSGREPSRHMLAQGC